MHPVPGNKVFSPLQMWIYDVTRSDTFIINTALLFIGLAFVLGGFFGKTPDLNKLADAESGRRLQGPITEDRDTACAMFREAVQDPARFGEVIRALPAATGVGDASFSYEQVASHVREILKDIVFSKLTGEQKRIAIAFLWSLYAFPIDVAPELEETARHAGGAPRYANLVVMWLHQANDRDDEAREALAREAVHPDAEMERLVLAGELIRAKRWAEVERLLKDATVKDALGPELELYLAVAKNEWARVTQLVMAEEAKAWTRVAHVSLASLGLLVWFVFLMQQVQRPAWSAWRLFAGLLGVALGVLSVAPTMLAVLWQDVSLGMATNGDPLNDAIYFTAGVGVREELAKLLLVLPLVPFLLKATRLEQLIMCACVGLGFGFQENLSYFENASAMVGYSRVLTANFLHMALTGVAGLALFDVVTTKGNPKALVRFFLVFLAVVVLHGVYDLFLVNEKLRRMPFFVVGSLAVLAMWFYGELRRERGPQLDFFAPPAVLAVGLGALFAATVVVASMELGFLTAIVSVGLSAMGLLLVLVIVSTLAGDISLDEYTTEYQRP